MIRYQIRSIALLNIVNDVNSGRLVPDAYFQRNLVWREIHKRDFIETILNGYPFPQMFFSRGKIDVDKMQTTACIVDGQQRTNAIIEFIENKFPVSGKYFKNLSELEKADFLKYEIGVIELDLDNDDPQVKEVFARVNRTSNSLSTIEKLTSTYTPTEYMFIARLLANDIEFPSDENEDDWRLDPNIPEELFKWAQDRKVGAFSKLFGAMQVFRDREISRRVHVMYVLNIMSTILSGFFNRNERTLELLNDYSQFFPEKEKIFTLIENTANLIEELNLPPSSLWTNKANFFSLFVALAYLVQAQVKIDTLAAKTELLNFQNNVPEDYALAAREAVNNKKQRQIRHDRINEILKPALK